MNNLIYLGNQINKLPISFIAFVLSVLTSLYLIDNYGVVNYSFVKLSFNDFTGSAIGYETDFYFNQLLVFFSKITHLNLESSARVLMIVAHAVIAFFVVLIGKQLELSKVTLWSLLFLLLSQANYNNFRVQIIAEPIYWALWICSIYILIAFHKKHTVLVVIVWCFSFLIAGFFNLAAWFWLVFFPFGVLFWRQWRTKPVYYALIGYCLFVCLVLYLPIFNERSVFNLFSNIIASKYIELQENLQSQRFDWLREDSNIFIFVYILTGGLSLIILKTMISLGMANTLLLFVALSKDRIQIISSGKLRFIIYIVIFSLISTLLTSLLQNERQSVGYFSLIFLLMIFSSTGLSYIFQKIKLGRYQKVTVLVLVWCLVAYIASGFINFGPSKIFIKQAGRQSITIPNLYSDNLLFLYYAEHDPKSMVRVDDLESLLEANPKKKFYFGFELNRKRSLPSKLENQRIITSYSNSHTDKFIIFELSLDSFKSNQQSQ